MKTCTKCLMLLPMISFSKKGVGRSSICKSCHNSYVRNVWYPKNSKKQIISSAKWRKTNIVKYKKQKYTKKGVDCENIDLLFEKANGTCMICGSKEKLVLDHCHKKNKIRGFLCDKCNKGLGFFKDNIETIKRAILYLERKGG